MKRLSEAREMGRIGELSVLDDSTITKVGSMTEHSRGTTKDTTFVYQEKSGYS